MLIYSHLNVIITSMVQLYVERFLLMRNNNLIALSILHCSTYLLHFNTTTLQLELYTTIVVLSS